MERRTLLFGALAVLAVVAIAVVVIGPGDFFIPEESETRNERLEGNNTTVLRSGTFTERAGHDVSGTVSLVRDDEGLVLQFEDYSQESGPDVFVYVTPGETPDTSDEIQNGRKIRLDGGEDGGESTLEGTFYQRLPDDVTAEDVQAVGIWCEKFSSPFGYATLTDESA